MDLLIMTVLLSLSSLCLPIALWNSWTAGGILKFVGVVFVSFTNSYEEYQGSLSLLKTYDIPWW